MYLPYQPWDHCPHCSPKRCPYCGKILDDQLMPNWPYEEYPMTADNDKCPAIEGSHCNKH